MGFTFFENGLGNIDISSREIANANGPAGPGPASPEAKPMHIDYMSTVASPFSEKVNPHLQPPTVSIFLNWEYSIN